MPYIVPKDGPNKGRTMYIAVCMLMECTWACSNLDPKVVRQLEREHWADAHGNPTEQVKHDAHGLSSWDHHSSVVHEHKGEPWI